MVNLKGTLRVDFQATSRIPSGSTFTFTLGIVFEPLLLSLTPRRLNYFVLLGGVLFDSMAPHPPPLPSQKKLQKPKNLQANWTMFLNIFGFSIFRSC